MGPQGPHSQNCWSRYRTRPGRPAMCKGGLDFPQTACAPRLGPRSLLTGLKLPGRILSRGVLRRGCSRHADTCPGAPAGGRYQSSSGNQPGPVIALAVARPGGGFLHSWGLFTRWQPVVDSSRFSVLPVPQNQVPLEKSEGPRIGNTSPLCLSFGGRYFGAPTGSCGWTGRVR